MRELIGNQASETRFLATMMGLFALLTLILAAVGIYGVISYSVAQRTQEIGIRVALGARPFQIMRTELQRGMALVCIGLGIGVLSAFALTRVLSSLLFGVSATDTAIFIAVSIVLALVGIFAVYIPARRAASVDPMVALRNSGQ
jgi:ABC-type antimicrobial peptide transport system permease subunit